MYSSPTAELSLDAPTRCLTSVPGDTRHHRFLVGTCALPSSPPVHYPQQRKEEEEGYGDGVYNNDGQMASGGGGAGGMANNNNINNRLYLLRYHEEMNEVAIDAQFELFSSSSTSTTTKRNPCGEMWHVSGCPTDATLLVTNTSTLHHHHHRNSPDTAAAAAAAETILWRMPRGALKEEDLDYYPHHRDPLPGTAMTMMDGDGGGGDGISSEYISSSAGGDDGDGAIGEHGGGGGGGGGDVHHSMEMVARLPPHSPSDDGGVGGGGGCPAILRGRISDMHWNPESLPDHDAAAFGASYSFREDDLHDGDGGGGGDGDDEGLGGSYSPLPPATPTNASGGGPNFLTIEHFGTHPLISTWDMRTSAPLPVSRITVPSSSSSSLSSSTSAYLATPPKGSWDPHNTNLVAVSVGRDVALVDLRIAGGGGGGGGGGGLQGCHRFAVSDVDYNPNVPHRLTTCGLDGLVKFWDLRHCSSSSGSGSNADAANLGETTGAAYLYPTTTTSSISPPASPSSINSTNTHPYPIWNVTDPLKTVRGGHSHWTTSLLYNPFHDQLLVSAGSDGMVNLWRVSSISSAPVVTEAGGGDAGGAGGGGGEGDGEGSGDDGGSEDDEELSGWRTTTGGEDDDHVVVMNDGEGSAMGVTEDVTDRPKTNEEEEEEEEDDGPDVRVTHMELSEAVYDVAWSAADPWIYACLGYDGSVVLNHVPSKEKYKILL